MLAQQLGNADVCGQLLHAARSGTVDDIFALVTRGADLNTRDEDGRTPIIIAARWNRLDVAKTLIGLGADVNARDNEQWSALLLACLKIHIEMVELLLNHGASIFASNSHNEDAQYIAKDNQNYRLIRIVETAMCLKREQTSAFLNARNGTKILRL